MLRNYSITLLGRNHAVSLHQVVAWCLLDLDRVFGHYGLRALSEFHIIGGNSLGLAVLGMGQDAHGEVYLTGNRSGPPFGSARLLLKIAPAEDQRDHDED